MLNEKILCRDCTGIAETLSDYFKNMGQKICENKSQELNENYSEDIRSFELRHP